MLDILLISVVIGNIIMAFVLGGTWLQVKETKFGKEVNFDCENCRATGCQAKYCKLMKEKRTRKL